MLSKDDVVGFACHVFDPVFLPTLQARGYHHVKAYTKVGNIHYISFNLLFCLNLYATGCQYF